MMRKAWIAILLLVAATATVLGAQAVVPEERRDVAAELAELNLTLLEIRDVLSRQLETDGLDLMLKRTELVSTDVARLETRLHAAERERESLDEEELRINEQIEVMTDQLRASGQEVSLEEIEAYSHQMQIEIERIRRRSQSLDGEIQLLQNRLTAKQQDLQSWQDIVDRRLGGV